MMNFERSGERNILLSVFFSILIITGCAAGINQGKIAAVPELRAGYVAGYLYPGKTLPNSLALIPPPPAPGSTDFALDEDVAKRSFALRGTPRFALAASDYDLRFPHAAGVFSCTLNAPITEQDTPRLYMLLRRSSTDAVVSTYPAKEHYGRKRPFQINNGPICSPEAVGHLLKSPSYPSGHTTIGWAWALILSEISPEQTDAIILRARVYGESRIVCNHHWNSDVMWGYFMGAATVARLHADPVFRADLEAAKSELEAVRAKGLKPTRDCNAEAAAMAIKLPPGRAK